MTLNLTALAEARAKMTPGEYATAEHDEDGPCGALHVVVGHEVIAVMPGDEADDDNAAGLVAEHNAMPVLLEVARASFALRDAHAELERVERDMVYVGCVSADQLLGIDTIRDAKVVVNAAGDALLLALAKVTR